MIKLSSLETVKEIPVGSVIISPNNKGSYIVYSKKEDSLEPIFMINGSVSSPVQDYEVLIGWSGSSARGPLSDIGFKGKLYKRDLDSVGRDYFFNAMAKAGVDKGYLKGGLYLANLVQDGNFDMVSRIK